MRSMTGFGSSENKNERFNLSIEIKTLNHKYNDIYLRVPRNLIFLEEKIRAISKNCIFRGKVEIFLSFKDLEKADVNIIIDERLVKEYISALNKLKKYDDIEDNITLSLITSFPDILKEEHKEIDQNKIWDLIKPTILNAFKALVEARKQEGRRLKKDVKSRLKEMGILLKKVKERAPFIVAEYSEKLNLRIKELMDKIPIDEARLATEIAIFADKCAVDEEIIRLASHLAQFEKDIKNDIPIGRKLDFMIQEMNREVNTIASKANDLILTKLMLNMKSEIEKIREQIQNIE